MRSFAERNLLVIGAVGAAATVVAVILGLTYRHLPFVNSDRHYSAYFTEAGGLVPGAPVQVSGYKVGTVSSVDLDGPQVKVDFLVAKNVRLGDRTEAAVKTKSLLGSKILEVTTRGEGNLSGPIPLERTTSAYQLPDALGDLATTINKLDTAQLSKSLATLSETFAGTPAQLQVAVSGLTRFSQTVDARDRQLRTLLENANKATKVLANRSDQVVSLISNTNELLAQLRTESDAVDQISASISVLSRQLTGFVADNRQQLKPALDKLNGVLTILANRRDRLQDVIKRVGPYAMSLGEAISSGPFFNSYVVNILPGQFIQPFIDAAFSDLGIDPHTLLPSQLSDPPVGQRATPALPVPFPRTGQGGDPRLTIPDAITGNPGDPRYPYRTPPDAPAPGGPPPGPPADMSAAPTPAPIYVQAPGEVPAAGQGKS